LLSRPQVDATDADEIVESIVYLYTETRRRMKSLASSHGLTGPQWTVLGALAASGDLSLSALSEQIRAKNSTVTGIVDRMVREGWVSRVRSVRDRRVIHIRLTSKGQDLARLVSRETPALLRTALGGLGPEEFAALRRVLGKLVDHVKSTPGTDFGSGNGR
jgi:DNA-binding MarR family transcriptional regulator